MLFILDELVTLLNSLQLPPPQGTTLEIEARFGKIENQKFVNSVSLNKFVRVRQFMLANGEPIVEVSKDEFYGNVRYTTITTATNKVSYALIKEKKGSFDFPEYGVRIGVALETQVTKKPVGLSTLVRDKERTSFLSSSGLTRIDFTQVASYKANQKEPDMKYEIEVEIIGVLSDESIAEFNEMINNILLFIQDTQYLYTTHEYSLVTGAVNTLSSPDKAPKLDEMNHTVLVHSRNLKIEDIVPGGLLSYDSENYTVTVKAEGIRKWLYISDSAAYLVMPPYDVNKIVLKKDMAQLSDYANSLFEGELIRDKNSETYVGAIFLVYDCLAFKSSNIMRLPHKERLQNIDPIVNAFAAITDYNVQKKIFYPFSKIEEFYKLCKFILSERYPYTTDGLIFTPYTTGYDSSVQLKPLSERRLTAYPDTCKWKPWNKLTIDFVVVSVQGSHRLFSNKSHSADLVEFIGSVDFPFNSATDLITKGLETVPQRGIAEFQPVIGHKLELLQIRTDKFKPNNIDIAVDVWNDINRPLTQEMMLGATFGLIRNFYSSMLDKIFEQLLSLKSIVIFGDRSEIIHKLAKAKFDYVIFVVSNEPSILDRKIKNMQVTFKYDIIQSDWQDIKSIYSKIQSFIPDKAVDGMLLSEDVLETLFLAIENIESLKQLINASIKHGGKIAVWGLNGKKVMDAFKNVPEEAGIKRSKLVGAEFSYNTKDQRLSFYSQSLDIKTISPVINLALLYYILNEQSIDEKIFSYSAMTESEITFSHLYSYIVITHA